MQKPQVSQLKNANSFMINDVDPSLKLDKCYLHVEGDKEFSEMDINDIPISTTLNSYGSNTINMLKGKKGWVIIPGYLNKLDDNGKLTDKIILSDIQLAVTGKCKKGETYISAVKRETKEELGFDIETKDVEEPWEPINGCGKFYKSKIYPCIVSPTIIKSEVQTTNKSIPESEDDFKRRIQSWFFVENPKDSSILNRVRSKNTDKAGEIIAIVSVDQLLKLLEVFVKQAPKPYKPHKPYYIK